MDIIYLILVHKEPRQLFRLINVLNEPYAAFVVHVDKKVPLSRFKKYFKTSSNNVHFITNRCTSGWGSFGLVQATLNGLKFVQRKYKTAQRVIILSGQDYPIKPISHIKAYLAGHHNTIFMEYFKVPYKNWYQHGLLRFPAFNVVNQAMPIYGGSQWLSFPANTIKVIFSFLKLNPDFLTYYREYVAIPDESFFQTLFLNCGLDKVIKHIINHNLHLIKWDKPFIHPSILNIQSIDLILKSEYLFARKFNLDESASILNFIDDYILNDVSHQKDFYLQQQKRISDYK